jgi:nucleoside-diphosphate-sugar epimerase
MSVTRIFTKFITKDIDIVFHLAALIAVPYSYIAPDSYVDTNVKGTLNIYQAARDYAQHLINATIY